MKQKLILIFILTLLVSCAAKKIEGEGPESRENIRAVIREAMPEIQECFQKELAENPKLEGKIVVSFTVADLGKVTESRIKSSTLKNENVHGCTLNVINQKVFPQPPAGTTVSVDYPFLFAANPAKTTEIPKSEN